MSVKSERDNVNGLHFITFTNYKWLHLFARLNMYEHIYDWFNLLDAKGEYITGFVIMPNHLHMLLFHQEENGSINKIIGNGKRFFTYEMIKRLKQNDDIQTLSMLSESITVRDKRKGQLHKGFEDSFDCKRCYTEKIITQKLNYIHNNPIQPKWQLSKTAEEYEHSSAAFYAGLEKNYSFNLKHYQSVLWQIADTE